MTADTIAPSLMPPRVQAGTDTVTSTRAPASGSSGPTLGGTELTNHMLPLMDRPKVSLQLPVLVTQRV